MAVPAISQERAEAILGPHFPAFGRCFINAAQDWAKLIPAEIRKDSSTTWKARFYWERANFHSQAVFSGTTTARLFVFRTIPVVEIDDAVWVRFKKMHSDKSTSGYPTIQRLTFERQGHLGWAAEEQTAFPWGEFRPMMVCGYTLDPFGQIKGLYIAYPNGSSNAYEIPISMGEATAFVMPTATPRTPGVLTDLPAVRRRRAK